MASLVMGPTWVHYLERISVLYSTPIIVLEAYLSLTTEPSPPGYTHNPDLVLASGPGFESTLNTFNFQPNSHQPGHTSSTPAMGTVSDGDQPDGANGARFRLSVGQYSRALAYREALRTGNLVLKVEGHWAENIQLLTQIHEFQACSQVQQHLQSQITSSHCLKIFKMR